MNFITKLFQGKTDSHVHSQFVRYSVGEYELKAVVKIKVGSSAKIVTSFEYVNDFLQMIGEHAKGELTVAGKIFLKKKYDTPFPLTKKKGYFMADIAQKITSGQLKTWVEAYGSEGYILLNVKGDEIELKTKTAPHNPRGKYNDAFCKVTVSGQLRDVLLRDIVFEGQGFKQAEVKHKFIINDVVIPKECESDMTLARILAKRKGKIIRTVILDGKESMQEKDFLV